MARYSERIVKGFGIVFVLMIAGNLIGYLLRLFLSRNMSAGDFGLFYAILAFIGLFGLFAELGFGQAIVKYISEFRVKGQLSKIKAVILIGTGIQLLIGVVITIIIILLSDLLAVNYFHNLGSSWPLILISASFVVGIILKNSEKVFQGFGRMKYYGLVETMRIGIVLVLALFFVSWGVFGIAAGYLLAAIITGLVCVILIFRTFPLFSVKSDGKGITRKLFKFGIPVVFAGLSGTVMAYSDTIFITFFRSVQEVGYYQAALPTARFLVFFSASLSIVLFPMFSEMWAKKEKEMMARIITILTKIIFIVIIPGLLVFLAFPEIIMRTLFGADYVAGAIVLQLIAVEGVFLSIIHVISPAIVGMGKPEIIAKITGVVAIIDLVMNIMLIPVIGIAGAALSTAAAEGLLLVILVYKLKGEIKIRFNKIAIGKIILGGLLTLGVIALLKSIIEINPPLLEAVLIFIPAVVFYGFFIIYSRVVIKGDLQILKDMKIHKGLLKKIEDVLRV